MKKFLVIFFLALFMNSSCEIYYRDFFMNQKKKKNRDAFVISFRNLKRIK